MNIQEEIISLIDKLDYTWYNSIHDLFIAGEGYDPDTKRIARTIPDFYTGGDGEPYDWTANCSLEEYAWDISCIEYPWPDEGNEIDDEKLPDQDEGSPVQGHKISYQILNIIKDHIGVSPKVIKQDKFITNILSLLVSRLNAIKEEYKDGEYSSVFTHFYRSFKARVSVEYGHIRRTANKKRDFKAFIKTDNSIEAPDNNPDTDYDSNEQRIREILKPLSGKWFKTVILNSGDFDILISNANKFIENKGDCNHIVKPFRTNSVSADFIRYTFNLLYREKMNGKIIQAKWASFLKKSFDVFNDVEEETIRKKFKVKPLKYENDLINTITY